MRPEEALPALRDVLENHRLEMEEGVTADDLADWVQEEAPAFDCKNYGFQEFSEFLNYAQDKTVVRIEPDGATEQLMVYLGAEFHPPAIPEPEPPPVPEEIEEEEEPQPIVPGQPTAGSPRVKKGTKKAAGGRSTETWRRRRAVRVKPPLRANGARLHPDSSGRAGRRAGCRRPASTIRFNLEPSRVERDRSPDIRKLPPLRKAACRLRA